MTSKFLPSLLFSLLFISPSYALDGDMYDFFLPNGLKVILMEKHATPKIGLGVYYNVGSHDELWGQKGITPIINRLVFEGTEKYPKEKLSELRDKFSMDKGDRDNRDMTYFYSELPKNELEFGLDFESDRMQNIVVNAESLNKIKKEYKLDYDNFHENYLWWRFDNMFKEILPDDHPYKIDDHGIWEQIDTLSVETCQKYYNQYYAPNNAVLVIVGDIVPEDATALIYNYFGSIKPSENIPPDPDFSFNTDVGDEIPKFFGKNKWDPFYEQMIAVNFFMPSARNDDTMILDHLEDILSLDRNKNGAIIKKITKNRWLCDIVFVQENIELGLSSFSVIAFNIAKNVSPHKVKKSVLSTFKYIGENGIDNEILDQYKKSALLDFYNDNNNYANIANRLGGAEIINGDYHFYNRAFELLEQLTNEDLKRVVNKYLNENNIYVCDLQINTDKKRWYFQFISFVAHNTFMRFWNPFIDG